MESWGGRALLFALFSTFHIVGEGSRKGSTTWHKLGANVLRRLSSPNPPPPCACELSSHHIARSRAPYLYFVSFTVQLISYAEMLASATNICSTLREIPCIGDGDTGYGNSVNVKRTVKGYAQVGTQPIVRVWDF